MVRSICLLVALAFAGALWAEEWPYTFSLKVDNPKNERKSDSTGNKGGGRSSSQSKTTRSKMIWPAKVSFRGKEFPSGIKLRFACLGTEDGKTAMLQNSTVDVTLDEKGDFKTDLISPEAVLTKTRTTKTSGGGGRRNGGGSVTTSSETKGTRITGCIVQLLIGDEVVRFFATKPTWAKLAKKNPLPEEEILKIR